MSDYTIEQSCSPLSGKLGVLPFPRGDGNDDSVISSENSHLFEGSDAECFQPEPVPFPDDQQVDDVDSFLASIESDDLLLQTLEASSSSSSHLQPPNSVELDQGGVCLDPPRILSNTSQSRPSFNQDNKGGKALRPIFVTRSGLQSTSKRSLPNQKSQSSVPVRSYPLGSSQHDFQSVIVADSDHDSNLVSSQITSSSSLISLPKPSPFLKPPEKIKVFKKDDVDAADSSLLLLEKSQILSSYYDPLWSDQPLNLADPFWSVPRNRRLYNSFHQFRIPLPFPDDGLI